MITKYTNSIGHEIHETETKYHIKFEAALIGINE